MNSVSRSVQEINKSRGYVVRCGNGLVVVRRAYRTVAKRSIPKREAITRFSPGAAIRMRRYLRDCRAKYTAMVTLTYPYAYPSDGRTVKNHLRRFLQEMQREASRAGAQMSRWSAFWFLEFQERGAPHFHVFATWTPPKGWVSRRWYEIVGSDDDRHLRAGSRVENLRRGRAGTIAYATKYAVKAEQKDVPQEYHNVGRFWGIYGDRTTVSADTWVSDAHIAESDKVEHAKHALFGTIGAMVQSGLAEVVVRKEGTGVLRVTDRIERMIRHKIHQINWAKRMDCMPELWDAELDSGMYYQGEAAYNADRLSV